MRARITRCTRTRTRIVLIYDPKALQAECEDLGGARVVTNDGHGWCGHRRLRRRAAMNRRRSASERDGGGVQRPTSPDLRRAAGCNARQAPTFAERPRFIAARRRQAAACASPRSAETGGARINRRAPPPCRSACPPRRTRWRPRPRRSRTRGRRPGGCRGRRGRGSSRRSRPRDRPGCPARGCSA